ncbi:MAG TPA: substrate-binding domain-containing protein, partial [Candidatus Blautia intestinipullorum]|nr:substrate-binding domain-containing protein [Candidatus Blautia intestinipullorum]
MRKAAVAVVLLAAAVLTAGGLVNGGFETFVADVQAEGGTAEENPEEERAARIDTSIPVQAGSRIAVVSKNVSGEFWDLIRQGMEDAVKDINTAYGFESDDKVTMTFEGPDDELNVEAQVNTLDAVIAENPTVLCLSASDMDSLQAQLESAAENGI